MYTKQVGNLVRKASKPSLKALIRFYNELLKTFNVSEPVSLQIESNLKNLTTPMEAEQCDTPVSKVNPLANLLFPNINHHPHLPIYRYLPI